MAELDEALDEAVGIYLAAPAAGGPVGRSEGRVRIASQAQQGWGGG